MKLDNKYSIEKSGSGIKLIEKTIGYKKDDKKKENPIELGKEYYYGVLYQALQGYMEKRIDDTIEYDSLDVTGLHVSAIIADISRYKAAIKDEFCVYVNTNGDKI